MLKFNSYQLRTDENGTTFLDLELVLSRDQYVITLLISLPASIGFDMSRKLGDSEDERVN